MASRTRITVLSSRPIELVAFALVLIALLPGVARAQAVEVTPVLGYRFGNDLFELAATRPVDADGAPVMGAAVNVEVEPGRWFEAMFTRQQAHVAVPAGAFTPAARLRLVVDQWLAGGREEFGRSRARGFVSGLVGLTHYRSELDNEVRFTAGVGSGVRVPIERRFGLRLDSRLFATFVEANAGATACAGGACLVHLNVSVVWQLEFTAQMVIVF